MIPVTMQGRSLFVRELAPLDLKLEVDQFSEAQAAHYLAFVVGKAHARQMDHATCKARRGVPEADRRGSIHAPKGIAAATRWPADGRAERR